MTDIEAIEWMKQIRDKYIHGGDEWFDEQRCKAIEYAIESIYKLNKWIPVSERLPFAEYGESEDVLTVSELGVIRVLYFDGGCWCYQTGECCPHKVTHWMPLPNPPKEV